MSQDLIPVRMLVQFVYCHRLAYMEWVQGEFANNFYVVDGKYQHRNVDRASGGKKLQEDTGETIHASSITVSDSRLGLVAKIDRMEKTGKTATPVEYKRGKTPDTPTKWYDSNMVQVCAQALLLRANGYECAKGVIYYAASRERVEITFTEEMVAMTLQAIADMRGWPQAAPSRPRLWTAQSVPSVPSSEFAFRRDGHAFSRTRAGCEAQRDPKDVSHEGRLQAGIRAGAGRPHLKVRGDAKGKDRRRPDHEHTPDRRIRGQCLWKYTDNNAGDTGDVR